MALVLLEGMDKVGKTTVAEYFRQKQKFEYIHMTAPAKWHSRDSYFAEMLHMIALTAGKKVIFDRTWYGEYVWPEIFGRPAKLTYMDICSLTTVARQLHKDDVRLIYMHDPDEVAHTQRIFEYNEPTYNFKRARRLYDLIANSNNFERVVFQNEDVSQWIN